VVVVVREWRPEKRSFLFLVQGGGGGGGREGRSNRLRGSKHDTPQWNRKEEDEK
jgi:hypothetical protein